MSTTDNEIDKSAQDQYNDAWGENAAAPEAQSDDAAFGIAPPEEAVAAAESGEGEVTADMAGEAAETAGAPIEAVSEEGQSATAAAPAQEDDDALPSDPKEAQRIKSWEGRLRKLEADLKAKAGSTEAAAGEALDKVSEQAEGAGNEALGEAAEKISEQVESGALTPAQAMKQLAEDFGEDFVKMIEMVAAAKAGEVGGQAVASIKDDVDAIISNIADADERTHFTQIAEAHPDFNDVRQSAEFRAFAQSTPALQKAASGGSAKDVIKLIKDFKASIAPAPVAAPEAPPAKPAPDSVGQADPEGADAAAGVRSGGGLRLPATPADSSDYEGAFEEAANSR